MEYTKKVGNIQQMLTELSALLKAPKTTQEQIADKLKSILKYVENDYFLCPECFKEAQILDSSFCGKVVLGCTNCTDVWTRFRK